MIRKQKENAETVAIHSWMSKDLGLTGNSLMIYAIVYQYSETYGDYSNGYRYLSEFTGASISTVMSIVKKLVEAGLLTREEEEINNNILPHFRAVRGLR